MAVALTVIQPNNVKSLCDCKFGRCDFSVPRVRFYLYVWRQAQIAREPFDVVLRDENKSSNLEDPAIRGGRHDPHHARMIAWSLEQARDVGHIPLSPWNAERLSRYLCPERYNEAAD